MQCHCESLTGVVPRSEVLLPGQLDGPHGMGPIIQCFQYSYNIASHSLEKFSQAHVKSFRTMVAP